ncbi:hypothetical protein J6590_034044 [Homalodisca vitripennis]|nr:hypothetical protein J6590_034044 [Homalodisca vitripennis]
MFMVWAPRLEILSGGTASPGLDGTDMVILNVVDGLARVVGLETSYCRKMEQSCGFSTLLKPSWCVLFARWVHVGRDGAVSSSVAASPYPQTARRRYSGGQLGLISDNLGWYLFMIYAPLPPPPHFLHSVLPLPSPVIEMCSHLYAACAHMTHREPYGNVPPVSGKGHSLTEFLGRSGEPGTHLINRPPPYNAFCRVSPIRNTETGTVAPVSVGQHECIYYTARISYVASITETRPGQRGGAPVHHTLPGLYGQRGSSDGESYGNY